MYHFCFWTNAPSHDWVTVLPLGISYADAKEIVRDQAALHPPTPEEEWTLGTIKIHSGGEALAGIANALPLWRWRDFSC